MNVYYGDIITCDKKNSICKYLVEDQGVIQYVGNKKPNNIDKKNIINLGNRALIPTFADTHSHFASYAVLANALILTKAKTNNEIIKLLEARDKELPKGKLLIAFGASEKVREGALVDRRQIDSVVSNRDVIIITSDGHSSIVNTRVLSRLPKKVQDENGYNADTGIIRHEAFYKVVEAIPKFLDKKDIFIFIQSAIDCLIKKGIGMLHACSGTGFPLDLDVNLIKWIARGQDSGFQVRVFFQTFDTDKVLKKGLNRLGGCFTTALDGSIGSRDAALVKPYENTNDKGILFHKDEDLYNYFSKAHANNIQIVVHAIGDAAFDQATKTFKRVLDENPRKDHRHGIIHASLPSKKGLEICRDYHIQIFAQTAFLDPTGEIFEPMFKALGIRVYDAEPYREMLDMGLVISAGSDAPVTMPEPIEWIYKACNNPNEKNRMTVSEALKMCTYNGYYATFDETDRGSLEKGKVADMVILSDNPFRVEIKDLDKIYVEETILKGKPFKSNNKGVLKTLLKGMISSGKF